MKFKRVNPKDFEQSEVRRLAQKRKWWLNRKAK